MRENDLVYYIHDGSTALRLQLSGDLSGDGVRDLAQTWRTASSVIGGRRLVIDVSRVTGTDPAGRALLEAWQAEGGWLVASSPAAQKRVESVVDLPVTVLETGPKTFTWPSIRVPARWVSALLVFLLPVTASKVRH